MALEAKSEEYDFVVVGGGTSGGYAINEFVNQGMTKGNVCMISSEKVLPYERPALSKGFLVGKAKLPDFNTCSFIKAGHVQEWYDTNKIRTYLNSQVTEVNFEKKLLTVKCHSDSTVKSIQYGKLLLATGASSVKLSDFKMEGSTLSGIYYLRDYEDGVNLVGAIEKLKSNGGDIVVIGGGYIGLEVTAALITHGIKKVTMIFPEEHLMQLTLFTKEIARYYEELYASKGVVFMKGGLCKSFSGEGGHVQKVHLNNGESVKASMVVVGIGARPNTQLFDKKLKMENRGVLVNELLQTSDPNVYACGDIATFPCVFTRTLMRLEHVRHARASAIHAVSVMVGKEKKAYDFLPVFYSRILDKSWIFYGEKPPNCDVQMVGDFKPKLMAIFSTKGQICGIFVESVTENEEKVVQEAVKKRVSIEQLKITSKDDVSHVVELLSKL